MAMTKADFQAMADALESARTNVFYAFEDGTASQASALAAVEHACEKVATACAGQYKGGYQFDRGRFLRACGMDA